MRILAIRGRNLASLEAEFELDLSRGALGGAGVFAIVGSTGAGKSTLLDALCVALFDRTPRLGNHSRVVVSRGDDDPTALGASDVRTLLRRGASSGWAEVDFEAGDGRRYRARWAVRRARGHSDGTMQDASITLVDLDRDERLGGTKTETLRAIHARLGLTFDQFRRSALLAQGEFATFLRADGKDRSELLERMTGTEIYSRLSIAAHARAAIAEQSVRDRRTLLGTIAILDDDARAAIAIAAVAARDAKAAAAAELVAAEHAARWVTEAARLAAAVDEAKDAERATAAAVAAAAPLRDELAVRRRAEAARATWDATVRAERAVAAATAARATAFAAEAGALATQAAAAERRERLASVHAPIATARAVVGAVAGAANGAKARRSPAREVGGDDRLIATAIAAAGDARWLVAHAALAPEIAAWPALDARFAQHAGAVGELARLDAALAQHASDRGARVGELATADDTVRAAGAQLAAAERVVAELAERRDITLDDAGKAEDAARRRCEDVERLGAIVKSARDAAGARDAVVERRTALADADAIETTDRAGASAARDHAATLRTERARALAELRKVAGYAHARTELVDDEPCPLCGSADHPWHGRGAIDALVADAAALLEVATAERDGHVRVLAALDANLAHRERERAALAAREREIAAATARAKADWSDALRALGELPLVDDPVAVAAGELASERLASARAALAGAREVRSRAVAIAKASDDAHARVQARRTELAACTARQREIAGALATIDADVARVGGERDGRVAHHAELAALLDAAIARWLAAVPGSERSIGAWAPAGATHATRATHDRAEVAAARAGLAALVEAWQRRATAIAAIDGALVVARTAHDERAREADRAVAELAARRDEAARRLEHAVAEHAEHAARLADQLAVAGLAAAELADLLAASPARLETLADQLAALERAHVLAVALVGERRRLVAAHAATSPPTAALAEAARVAELATLAAAAADRAAALAVQLAADDDARARRAAAGLALAAAEAAAETDRVLGAAIGSHDGKLFRSFAQSLTLDALLAVANAHLEELAPRYQLQRVPRHDLELQVIDRDLGADVRSVQSLSGGESFLVSLALALGLSSMSAQDVRVRTLLIDEGFGSLDPATLDGALAVLDALQATGRQVGVISHVPALIERVGAHVRVIPRGGGRSDVIVGA